MQPFLRTGAVLFFAAATATGSVAAYAQCAVDPYLAAQLTEDGENDMAFDVDGEVAYLNGTITDAILCKLKQLHKEHPEVETLVFEDVAGSVDDETNLKAGLLLHKLGYITELEPGSVIASGGVDLFLAGVERYGVPQVEVGVHSWSDSEGNSALDFPRDHAEHKPYLDYFEAIGIDPEFYWFTLEAAAPEDIHIMTLEEMARFGVFTETVE